MDWNAIASEIGPIRPRYIVAIIIILPIILNDEVRFLDKPTVAVALTVSYSTSITDADVAAESISVEASIIPKDIQVTATALRVA